MSVQNLPRRGDAIVSVRNNPQQALNPGVPTDQFRKYLEDATRAINELQELNAALTQRVEALENP